MKRTVIAFVLALSSMLAFGQQEFMVTNYMYNGLALNPAYAGVHGGISTSFLLREQWVGIDGAPSTQLASIHSPINHRPISLGALVYYDKIGPSSEFGTYLSYAYRIPLTGSLKLSMGLQMTGQNYKINYDLNDNNLSVPDYLGSISELKWNFGAGLLVHNDRFYLGAAIPQMLDKKLDVNDPDGQFATLVRHYYISSGYAFDVGPNLVVKPNVLLKAVQNAPLQIDLNANVLIMNKVWAGISYRSLDSFDGLLSLQVNPQLQIGYSVDITQTEIDAPSHEIMVNYIFNLPTSKIVTPRYF